MDIETYCDLDLKKSGVYPYAEHPSFQILLCGVSVDGGPVRVYDLAAGEIIPAEILHSLTDKSVKKYAHNAGFERICFSRLLRDAGQISGYLPPEGWYCTMVWSAYAGLPLSLEDVGAAMGLEQQKLTEGKDLIRYFCQPCKPTKTNKGRTRNLAVHAPEKWQTFVAYNKRDVEVEMQIAHRLRNVAPPPIVWQEYWDSEAINDRGIAIDRQLVAQAIRLDALSQEQSAQQLREITGVANPRSVTQMKQWLQEAGVSVDTLGKKDVQEMMKGAQEPLRSILALRLELAKSSVKKYTAMKNAVCADGRLRGMFMFYGAARSGRFAGRIVQLQNLYRNDLPDLENARSLVKAGNLEGLELLYDSVPEILAQLTRTAFIPSSGNILVDADFAAIEARVIAWLAGEQWRQEAFARGEDIYCASASQMFHVPVVKHGINGELRQKGKIAELALGYGGSVGALTAMGALDMGLSENELQPLVSAWRTANPNIVRLWWDVDKAVKEVIQNEKPQRLGPLKFTRAHGRLQITLPSGRSLNYVRPRIGENRFGGESVTYMGVDSTHHWAEIESYGPKFVENIVQGIARDVLCFALHNIREYGVVAHIHDEALCDVPHSVTVEEVADKMAIVPPWAEGLILRADGYSCAYFQKDA